MGDLVPFKRRRKRWTRPEDYGQVLPARRWQGLTRWQSFRRGLIAWRPWLLLAVLLGLWFTLDPALVEPPAFLSSDPETISSSFIRCGLGRGANCVVDGDTLKLGERKIRIIGVDAPETHPSRCAEEARLGEAATAELQRLLNQGPFTMTGRIDDLQDFYGRDLRAITRLRPDGPTQSIAQDLMASGTVRRYLGGLRGGWC